MQVIVDDKTYRVDFRHGQEDSGQRFTHCKILEQDGAGWTLVAGTFSYCHPNDQFSREIGRKKSLAKALKELFPMPLNFVALCADASAKEQLRASRAKVKAQRKAFWIAYVERLTYRPLNFSTLPFNGPLCATIPKEQYRIFEAISRERAYQDEKWGGAEHDGQHEFDDWMGFIDKHIQKANDALDVSDRPAAKAELIQIAALITACLEVYGVVEGHAALG